jgi:hypothetical protein
MSDLRCWYCGIPLVLKSENTSKQIIPNLHVLDHQVPKSWGKFGDDRALRADNLVDSCWKCNAEKSDRDVTGYREFLEAKTDAGKGVQFLLEAYRVHYCITDLKDFFLSVIKRTREEYPMPVFYGEEVANGKISVV